MSLKIHPFSRVGKLCKICCHILHPTKFKLFQTTVDKIWQHKFYDYNSMLRRKQKKWEWTHESLCIKDKSHKSSSGVLLYRQFTRLLTTNDSNSFLFYFHSFGLWNFFKEMATKKRVSKEQKMHSRKKCVSDSTHKRVKVKREKKSPNNG